VRVNLGFVDGEDVRRRRDPPVLDDLDADQPAVVGRLNPGDTLRRLAGQLRDLAQPQPGRLGRRQPAAVAPAAVAPAAVAPAAVAPAAVASPAPVASPAAVAPAASGTRAGTSRGRRAFVVLIVVVIVVVVLVVAVPRPRALGDLVIGAPAARGVSFSHR
jgi:cobalamin biosynthesis Mg chelatase CobN